MISFAYAKDNVYHTGLLLMPAPAIQLYVIYITVISIMYILFMCIFLLIASFYIFMNTFHKFVSVM